MRIGGVWITLLTTVRAVAGTAPAETARAVAGAPGSEGGVLGTLRVRVRLCRCLRVGHRLRLRHRLCSHRRRLGRVLHVDGRADGAPSLGGELHGSQPLPQR